MAFNSPPRRLFVALTTTCLFAATQVALAQLPDLGKFGGLRGGLGNRDSKVSLDSEFTAPANDRPAMLFVTARIAPGFHVYAVDQGQTADGGPRPIAIRVDDDRVKVLGAFRPIEPPAVHIDDKAWKGLELREHVGQVTWYAPIELSAGANAEELAIEVSLEGQVCDPNVCIPIETTFSARLGEGMAIPAQPVQAEDAPHTSVWAVAAYGVLGGLILNLMPCVLPVIGLKIFSFAKQGGQSRAHVFSLNLSYAGGLLTVFLMLATLAAAVQLGLSDTNYGWGQIYQVTWFKVAMTVLVFAMGLSFLGVWEIPIPGFATSGKATAMAAQEGMLGAFCMGAITTLLAVPCSGPFLGPVLGYTISQPPLVTYVVFFSIGLGMALPYLLIGAFPALIARLPKPGEWMETLKNLMGFAMLATVVYLFSTLNQKFFISTLALLVSVGFACWLVGREPVYAPARERLRAWGVGLLVAVFVGAVAFWPREPVLPWQPYSPEALAMARAQGKTVLVDFTANWCPNCKWNLATAINRQDVKKLVEQNDVVTMLADWSDYNETIKQALLELNSQSIPLLAIYPADPSREVLVLRDVLTKDEVLEALVAAGPSLDHQAAAVADDQAAGDAPDAPEFGAMPGETKVR